MTFPSDFVRGRFALAMYRQMEFTDLVADGVEVRIEKYFCCLTVRPFKRAHGVTDVWPPVTYPVRSVLLIFFVLTTRGQKRR